MSIDGWLPNPWSLEAEATLAISVRCSDAHEPIALHPRVLGMLHLEAAERNRRATRKPTSPERSRCDCQTADGNITEVRKATPRETPGGQIAVTSGEIDETLSAAWQAGGSTTRALWRRPPLISVMTGISRYAISLLIPLNRRIRKGEVHEDWGMISYDRVRKVCVLRQFHVEGFVNQYVAQPTREGALTFTSEAIENFRAGCRARETYTITGPDSFVERFELAEPGKDFELYSETRFHRRK